LLHVAREAFTLGLQVAALNSAAIAAAAAVLAAVVLRHVRMESHEQPWEVGRGGAAVLAAAEQDQG
jgi:hypothetical protein